MPRFSRLKKKALPMSMVGFPLLLIPLAIYNIIVFLMPGVSLVEPVAKLTLMSGAEWPLTLSDMMLALGIVLLLFEVIKGARPGAKYLTDHLLSLVVFGAAAAEFLLWPRFGTSTYFLLTLLALVDFLSGLALRARRGVPVASTVAVSSRRGAKQPAPVAAEPEFEPAPVPAPAPSVPAGASVAEAVLMDHPEPQIVEPKTVEPRIVEPKIEQPASAAPSEPSLEVPSPGLQPSNGAPPSPEEPHNKV
jgi:hypothetical protein